MDTVQLKIIPNRDEAKYIEVTQSVKDNEGYCPCKLIKNADTKCICKEFREQDYVGKCHCERYEKVER